MFRVVCSMPFLAYVARDLCLACTASCSVCVACSVCWAFSASLVWFSLVGVVGVLDFFGCLAFFPVWFFYVFGVFGMSARAACRRIAVGWEDQKWQESKRRRRNLALFLCKDNEQLLFPAHMHVLNVQVELRKCKLECCCYVKSMKNTHKHTHTHTHTHTHIDSHRH